MAMITFAGPGSSKAKRRFWVDRSDGVKSIKAAHRYKHLGTNTSDNLRFGPEIAAKRARMQTAAAPFKKRFLADPAITPPARAAVADIYLLTVLLHNAVAWQPLSEQEHKHVSYAVLWAYRLCADAFKPNQPHKSDDAVLTIVARPSPAELMHTRRAAHMPRMLRCAPAMLVALVQATSAVPNY